MELNDRIKAFVELGKFLKQFEQKDSTPEKNALNSLFYEDCEALITTVKIYNPWFTENNVRNALAAIADSLQEEKLITWIASYVAQLDKSNTSKTVAVIMAGNVPMVGFHDLLCVLISGNKFIGKLSSDDKLLLPFISKVLIAIEPQFTDYISFTEGQIKTMDAVIATGSNNSARYFDYYFGKYPNIIRKNRNSVAVLSGNESEQELKKLGKDIFQYFGLGCRNVSKLFVPKDYNFNQFFEGMFSYQSFLDNNKYLNNYEYNRTVYLMKGDKSLLDNNFLLIKQDESHSSPIGVLFYEYYDTLESVNKRFVDDKEKIQCIVSTIPEVDNAIPFGEAQCPTLSDYADGIDTMDFLLGMK